MLLKVLIMASFIKYGSKVYLLAVKDQMEHFECINDIYGEYGL